MNEFQKFAIYVNQSPALSTETPNASASVSGTPPGAETVTELNHPRIAQSCSSTFPFPFWIRWTI